MTRDDGSATVEFTYLALLLMVPLVYLLLTVFAVQRATFAVSAAAREAGRAYAQADAATAVERARAAARLILVDHDLVLTQDGMGYPHGRPEAPGSTLTITVRTQVRLPIFGLLLRSGHAPSITVTGRHVVTIDRFRRR